MRFWLAAVLGGLIATGLGCGGAELSSPDDPLIEITRAELAGPLCRTRSCECRAGPDDAGMPGGVDKRYEFRIGPVPGEMWVTVGEHTLYKSREQATQCFYLDLESGKHTVEVRARGETGFSAAVRISEMGAEGPWWYDTFNFNCGAPGRCTLDRLEHWRERFLAHAQRNVIDTCGSTAIRDIKWRTGRLRDRVYPTSLLMQFVLDVYSFTPRYPPGHRACAR